MKQCPLPNKSLYKDKKTPVHLSTKPAKSPYNQYPIAGLKPVSEDSTENSAGSLKTIIYKSNLY